jgi:hypothetical protein
MGSGVVIYIPIFIKIGSGIQKLIGWDTQTAWRSLKPTLIFFQNNESIVVCFPGNATSNWWVLNVIILFILTLTLRSYNYSLHNRAPHKLETLYFSDCLIDESSLHFTSLHWQANPPSLVLHWSALYCPSWHTNSVCRRMITRYSVLSNLLLVSYSRPFLLVCSLLVTLLK